VSEQQTPEERGWQPIETAPRDKAILIGGGLFQFYDYSKTKFEGVSIAYWYQDHWRGSNLDGHEEWNIHWPTHWMPLPESPK
jgi:hypothetical protein